MLEQGFAAIERGEAKSAVPLLEEAAIIDPYNARIRYELGYALIELTRWEDAVVRLEEARKLNPVHAPTLVELGFCYSGLGRYGELRGPRLALP